MQRLLTGILLLLVSAAPAQAGGKLSVVTTTPDLAAIALEVVGEAGSVYAVARPD